MRYAGEVYALNGPCYYYNLECRAVAGTKESNWDLGPKLVHGDAFLRTSWKELRLPSVVARRVSDASWHFGYLMTLDEMRTKLCLNSDIAVRRACASASILNRLAVGNDGGGRGWPGTHCWTSTNRLVLSDTPGDRRQ